MSGQRSTTSGHISNDSATQLTEMLLFGPKSGSTSILIRKMKFIYSTHQSQFLLVLSHWLVVHT